MKQSKKRGNHRVVQRLTPRQRKKKKTKLLYRKTLENDYLKYYYVVMHWAMAKYELDRAYIEMMFYLYSRRLFTEQDMQWYRNSVRIWSADRKKKLKQEGWITIWENSSKGKTAVYELSLKGRRFVESFYRKLNGEEPIPTNYVNNPMFKKNNRFVDKVMIPKVWEFNDEYKEKLKQAQESQKE